jgi:TM2 domain-containing membrane protein YozV
MTDMAEFEDFESGTAVQYAPEEPEKTEEKGGSEVAYDVDLGNNIEFEVETESAPEPEPAPEPEREYRRQVEDFDDFGRGYTEDYEGGFFGRNRRPAYRRMNKHIYTWVLSFFLGIYGADRFARGQIGLGLLKLMTFGGFGFWYLADVVIAAMKSYAGEYRDSDDVYFDIYGQYTT